MSAAHTPETSFEFIAEWFERAAKSATAKGNRDSAQLWRDGLQHLAHFNAERDRLKAANAELAEVLRGVEQRCATWHFVGQDGQFLKVVRAALTKHQKETA